MRGIARALAVVLVLATAPFQAGAVCLDGDQNPVPPKHFPLTDDFRSADFVLVACVVSEKRLEDQPYPANYVVAPIKAYKGAPPPILTIYSNQGSAGFGMDVGKTYLLFVQKSEKVFYVDKCGWSDAIAQSSEALAQLKLLAPARNLDVKTVNKAACTRRQIS